MHPGWRVDLPGAQPEATLCFSLRLTARMRRRLHAMRAAALLMALFSLAALARAAMEVDDASPTGRPLGACTVKSASRVQQTAAYGRYAQPGPYSPRRITVTVHKVGAVATRWKPWTRAVFRAVAFTYNSPPATENTFAAMFFYPGLPTNRSSWLSRVRSLNPGGPIAPGTFPVIGFAPGWSCNTEHYIPIFEQLASHGFIVAAPRVFDVLSNPFFTEAAADFNDQTTQLLSAVAWAQRNPEWAGRVDVAHTGLAGHSAGGGIAVQSAIALGANVTAIATLGGWLNIATTPWLSSLAASMTAPAMAVSAEFDTRAPVAENAQVLLNASLAPVLLPVLAQGTHCFLNWRPVQSGSAVRWRAGLASLEPLMPLAGESDCTQLALQSRPPTCGPTQEEEIAQGATLLTAWFALYLQGDSAASQMLWGPGGDNAWMLSVQRSAGIALEAVGESIVTLSPNTTATLRLRLRNLGATPGSWALSAALQSSAPASLRVSLSASTLTLAANSTAIERRSAAAAMPRVDAVSLVSAELNERLYALLHPAPRTPRRKLLQTAPPQSAEFTATLSAAAGAALGTYNLTVSAACADGTTAFVRVPVLVAP